MKKKYSLKKNEDIQKILSKGRFFRNREFIMYVVDNDTTKNYVAFLVGKKLGNAPLRNRYKRKMRSMLYCYWPHLVKGKTIVIMARPMILEENHENLKNSLEFLLKRHKILTSK
ncbi:MAG: ribonuclease P protein component [Culicoidibacterales bacterium]